MIDAVYVLGKGSRLENAEIRFSVRSLEMYAENLGRIFIVGEQPDFFEYGERLIHVPFNERLGACANVWEKLHCIAHDERISDRFVFCNDDFYVVKTFDAANIPYYGQAGDLATARTGNKPLKDTPINRITVGYHRVLKNTLTALQKRGLPTLKFNTHQPMNLEREKVREVFYEFQKEIYAGAGLSFRCCYGNYFGLERIAMPTKVARHDFHVPRGRFAFSSHSAVDAEMLFSNLEKLYPERSNFERVC